MLKEVCDAAFRSDDAGPVADPLGLPLPASPHLRSAEADHRRMPSSIRRDLRRQQHQLAGHLPRVPLPIPRLVPAANEEKGKRSPPPTDEVLAPPVHAGWQRPHVGDRAVRVRPTGHHTLATAALRRSRQVAQFPFAYQTSSQRRGDLAL